MKKLSELEKSERFGMNVTPAFMKAVDNWRIRQPDIPGRGEAIRRLVEKAIAADEGINAKMKGKRS